MGRIVSVASCTGKLMTVIVSFYDRCASTNHNSLAAYVPPIQKRNQGHRDEEYGCLDYKTSFTEAEALWKSDKEPRKVVNESSGSGQQDDGLDKLDGLDEDGRGDEDEGQEPELVPVPSKHRSESFESCPEVRFRKSSGIFYNSLDSSTIDYVENGK